MSSADNDWCRGKRCCRICMDKARNRDRRATDRCDCPSETEARDAREGPASVPRPSKQKTEARGTHPARTMKFLNDDACCSPRMLQRKSREVSPHARRSTPPASKGRKCIGRFLHSCSHAATAGPAVAAQRRVVSRVSSPPAPAVRVGARRPTRSGSRSPAASACRRTCQA